MLPALLLSLLLATTLSPPPTASAHAILKVKPPTLHIPNQQQQQPLQQYGQYPIQEHEPTTRTTTLHTTLTSYILYSTITATLTRYTLEDESEATAVPEAVQTWYAAQKEEGCDRTACASCRVWYRCGGGGNWEGCEQCDGAAYCLQCEG